MQDINSIRLLLIEDDPNAVELIHQMLDTQLIDFTIEDRATLAAGAEALDSEHWDAILLDLSLPDSDGIDTFKSVHAKSGDSPIIVLTGHSDESLAIEAVQLGAQDYLVKGRVDSALLVRSIRYAIERSRSHGEVRRAYAELESRVERRTRELREANEQLQQEIAMRQATEERLRESNQRLEEALASLRESQHQLVQRERLHALGNMASGIAHDFNNALSPIVGLPDLLLQNPEKLEDSKLVARYLEMIRAAASNAGRVVHGLRDFYRDQHVSEEFHPVDLNDLIQRTVDITKPKWHDLAMARGVSIQIHTDLEDTPPVFGLENDLTQVLTNLVFNAVEALQSDGVITIRTRVRGGNVMLEVEDDGVGMDSETLRQCMDPFFSTKGDESSGFGLPTTFGIIDRHGATLGIDSAAGSGTLVRVKFPASTEQPAEPAAPAPAGAGAASESHQVGKRLRILAADDEPMIREVLKACLATDQHTVTLASDGHELLDHFDSGTYDLVITDRAMPGLSGDQVAKAVKEQAPAMKVMLLTGFGELMATTNEVPEGVDLVVAKPFTVDDIRAALGKLLAAG